MLSLSAYKLIHLLGIFALFTGLGGAAVFAMGAEMDQRIRKLCGMAQGVGLVLILVAGFGQLAKLDLGGWPLWVWLKLAIWVAFGAITVLFRRAPGAAKALFLLLPLLGGLAAYLAIFQP